MYKHKNPYRIEVTTFHYQYNFLTKYHLKYHVHQKKEAARCAEAEA